MSDASKPTRIIGCIICLEITIICEILQGRYGQKSRSLTKILDAEIQVRRKENIFSTSVPETAAREAGTIYLENIHNSLWGHIGKSSPCQ